MIWHETWHETWHYMILHDIIRDLHIHSATTSRGFPQAIAPLERNIKPEEFISFNGGGPFGVGWCCLWLWRLGTTFSNFWVWGWEVEICFIIWLYMIYMIYIYVLYISVYMKDTILKKHIDVRYVKLFQVDFFFIDILFHPCFLHPQFFIILPQDFMVLLRFPTTGRDLWKRPAFFTNFVERKRVIFWS